MASLVWRNSQCLTRHLKSKVALKFVRWNTVRSTANLGVDMNEDTGICTLTMQNAPVNTLTMDMFTDLSSSLASLHEMPQCKAVILTSNQRVFTAGLDLAEFVAGYSDEARLRKYWTSMIDTVIQMYSMRPLLVVSINASAPAIGCIFAMASDYRIMVQHDKYSIGLNEPQLGLDVANWVTAMFSNTVSEAVAMRYLPYGTLFSVHKALEIGLLDEVCKPEDLKDRTLALVQEKIKIDEESRYHTKMFIRESIINRVKGYKPIDTDYRAAYFQREDIHNRLQSYLTSLKKSK